MIVSRRIGVIATALALVACGSDDGDAGKGNTTPSNRCGIDSGFDGDSQCVPAPLEGQGLQLHFGPSSYTDKAETDKYLIKPGEEFVSCLYLKTPNDQDVYFNQYEARLRPGSHHLRLFTLNQDLPDGVRDCNLMDALDSRFLFGATSPTIQVPLPGQEFGADVAGLAVKLPANSQMVMEVHFYNTGQTDLLQEAWANFGFAESYDTLGDAISLIGGVGMNVPAGQTQTIKASATVPEDMRALVLVGHYHAHTTRFAAYWTPKGGERVLVNESYDWHDPATLSYDTRTQNAAPDATARKPGGWNGPLELKKGDLIDWECVVENSTQRPLQFENQVYSAEMCNVFGLYAPSFGDAWNAFRL